METDLVAISKRKLVLFRVKELKDILAKLGLPKQGKKQDLVERILLQLSDEGVGNIIDHTYRKMQMSEAADLATMGQGFLDLCNVKLGMEVADSFSSDRRIHCPCGTSLLTESIIQCVDPGCLVKQHASCVIIPEKPMEDIPQLRHLFLCETCRIKRADPFWMTVVHLVSPMKLVASNIPTNGTNPLQNAEATFQLTKAQRELLHNTEYEVQVWCILLNDKVPFRIQWPLLAKLQVNGVIVRAINRPGTQLLGANGRDDGALVTFYICEGVNQVSLSGCDSRNFCFGVRLVKRLTVEQVLSLVPKESAGESFEESLARVRRCIGGGMATGNEESDGDLEVIAESITVNLRCPMSGSRIKVAGRFKPCIHMGCFDLETFVELNQRARKWQCPICLKNYCVEDLIIDPYFCRVTTMMRNCGEDITEIEVKLDGSWRVKTKGERTNIAEWNFPSGSSYTARSEGVSHSTTKQLEGSGQSIIDRIKRNLSANIEVSKYQSPSPMNHTSNQVNSNCEKIIAMSSSASGSSKDVQNPSINRNANSCQEINDTPRSIDPIFGSGSQTYGLIEDTDIIVLSDSEEENDHLGPSTYPSFYPVEGASTGISLSYFQNPDFGAGTGPCFGPFNDTVDDEGLSNWSYPSAAPEGCHFQLFDVVSNISDAFTDIMHPSVACSFPMNGCSSASKSTVTFGRGVLEYPVCHPDTDISEQLNENALLFASNDPSVGRRLPTQPTALFSESNPEKHLSTSHGILSANWISLSLGKTGALGDIGSGSLSAATNGMGLRSSCRPNGASLEGEPKCSRLNDRKTSDGPFSFPRQRRSVRQKVHPL